MYIKGHARERGANLVEAALVIPLLLILLATVVDLGRAYFAYITVINAAREGAREGARSVSISNDTARICGKVLAEAQDQTPPLALTCPGDVQINSGNASGAPIRVTITYNFPVILGGILGRATVPIYYSVAFRIR